VKNKFIVYAIMVTVLFTGISWSRMIRSASNSSRYSSGYYGGSSWSSNTGSWGGGGGGHK
jgi:hypothetical protein